jgi:hypothetical protein
MKGTVNVYQKKCEGCGLRAPSFGRPATGKARWCGGCAKGCAGRWTSTGEEEDGGGDVCSEDKVISP